MNSRFLLILWIGIVVSACAFYGLLSKEPKFSPEKVVEDADTDDDEEVSIPTYEEIVEAYYKSRPIRNVPDTADFSAYLAAEYAKERKDFKAASTYLRRVADSDLENVDFQKEASFYTVLAGDVEKALPYAQRVLEKTPNDFFNQLLTLSSLVKKEENDEVLKALDQFFSGNAPGSFGFIKPLAKAWVYTRKGDKVNAFSFLDQVKDWRDEKRAINLLPLYYLHSALVYDYFEDFDTAAKTYNQLLHNKDSHSVRTLMLVRSFDERTGKLPDRDYFLQSYLKVQAGSFVSNEAMVQRPYKEQINTLPKAISLILFDIGGSLGYLEKNDFALYFAQLALYLDRESMLNVYYVGETLEKLNALDQADALYAQVKEGQPLYWSFQLKSAMNKIKLEKDDEAIVQLKSMIDRRPNIPLFYMTLGDAYQKKKDFEKAKDAYDKAIKTMGDKSPDVGTLYFLRGVCYDKLSRIDEAVADMEKAISYDKENPLYLNYLGYLMMDNGRDLTKAMELVEKAVKLLPNNGAILDSQGWGYYLAGKYEDALKVLEKAVQLESENAVVNDHLGDIYWKLGRKREARFQWSHALTLEEENSDALRERIKEKLKNQKD